MKGETGGLLVVDAGDLLFHRAPLPPEEVEGAKLRAERVSAELRETGVDALVPGERDLALGLADYERRVAGLPVLAANLSEAEGGRTPFPGSRVVTVGGVRVGLVGVVGAGPFEGVERIAVSPPEAAARGAVEAVRREGAQLVVLVAHLAAEDLVRLLGAVEGVHVGVSAHTGRFILRARPAGEAWVVATSTRSRHLGRVDLWLERPPYRLADAGVARAVAREVARLEGEVQRFSAGVEEATSKAMRAYYERKLAALEADLAGKRAEMEETRSHRATGGSRFRLRQVAMDGGLPDEPRTAARVAACRKALKAIGAPVSPVREKRAEE